MSGGYVGANGRKDPVVAALRGLDAVQRESRRTGTVTLGKRVSKLRKDLTAQIGEQYSTAAIDGKFSSQSEELAATQRALDAALSRVSALEGALELLTEDLATLAERVDALETP